MTEWQRRNNMQCSFCNSEINGSACLPTVSTLCDTRVMTAKSYSRQKHCARYARAEVSKHASSDERFGSAGTQPAETGREQEEKN